MTISVIITAGGSSARFGKNKLLEKINGKTVIEHTIDAFKNCRNSLNFDEIVISANNETADALKNLKIIKDSGRIKIVRGGKTRQESVFNALKNLNSPDFVLIHDGARPFISKNIIEQTCRDVQKYNAVIVAVRVKDTIKQVDNKLITATLARETLWQAQTPQAFEYKLILDAHKKLEGQNYTDDAGMLESLGVHVFISEGEYSNIKITTPDDLNLKLLH